MRDRAAWSLLLAAACPLLLLAIDLAGPESAARVPTGLLAIVWAPGHAALALLYPLRGSRLSWLERVAISIALGLALAPLVGLAVSLGWSLTGVHVAATYAGLTIALSLGALARLRAAARGDATPALHAPSTRATLAISSVALLASAGIFVMPLLTRAPLDASLALGDATGSIVGLTRDVQAGDPLSFVARLSAGDAARAGRLVATLDGATLLDQDVRLERGATLDAPVHAAPLANGTHELRIVWSLTPPREVHAWLDATQGQGALVGP